MNANLILAGSLELALLVAMVVAIVRLAIDTHRANRANARAQALHNARMLAAQPLYAAMRAAWQDVNASRGADGRATPEAFAAYKVTERAYYRALLTGA